MLHNSGSFSFANIGLHSCTNHCLKMCDCFFMGKRIECRWEKSVTFLYLLNLFWCKECRFLLQKLFGPHLSTGDYRHLVVDHSAMLLQHFRSFYKYSGQGFESSHKLHQVLYSHATNHDSSGPGQSCKLNQILKEHIYTVYMIT